MLIFTTITFSKENNPMQIEVSAMKGPLLSSGSREKQTKS